MGNLISGDALAASLDGLSVRARNVLNRLDVHTVGELAQISRELLISQKNFGETTLTEVNRFLAERGLCLATTTIVLNSRIQDLRARVERLEFKLGIT